MCALRQRRQAQIILRRAAAQEGLYYLPAKRIQPRHEIGGKLPPEKVREELCTRVIARLAEAGLKLRPEKAFADVLPFKLHFIHGKAEERAARANELFHAQPPAAPRQIFSRHPLPGKADKVRADVLVRDEKVQRLGRIEKLAQQQIGLRDAKARVKRPV